MLNLTAACWDSPIPIQTPYTEGFEPTIYKTQWLQKSWQLTFHTFCMCVISSLICQEKRRHTQSRRKQHAAETDNVEGKKFKKKTHFMPSRKNGGDLVIAQTKQYYMKRE